MHYLTREERMINLEKMYNTRDLGGYETQDSCYTKTHRFVRAASPALMTQADQEKLYDYGVRIEVDLRGNFEREKAPSKLEEYKDIEYFNVDLLAGIDVDVIPKDMREFKSMADLYIMMLDYCKPKIKEVFTIFLEHLETTILFNCSAGKDRTGVIAALLLDLAGCHDYDIVKDYMESFENIQPMYEMLLSGVGEDQENFLASKPQYMMLFLDHLRENYGSAKTYLLELGFLEEEVQELEDSFKI